MSHLAHACDTCGASAWHIYDDGGMECAGCGEMDANLKAIIEVGVRSEDEDEV